jgi:long-chain acyl-CoA synthetase
MQTRDLQTPVDRLIHWAQACPNTTYLQQPIDGHSYHWTWSQTLDETRRMAAALRAQGLPRGSRIGVLSKSCAHWIMADLAIMLAGYVSVPLYQKMSGERLRSVLDHSRCGLVFVGKLDEPARIDAALPRGLPRICFPYPDAIAGKDWVSLLLQFEPIGFEDVPTLDEVATVIYTAGRAGKTKDAVFRFRQIAQKGSDYQEMAKIRHGDHTFSYLSLSDEAERWAVEMASLYAGADVTFAESIDTLLTDLQLAQPTHFVAAPGNWERIQMAVLEQLPQRRLDRLLSIPIMSGLVKRRIRRRLGLSRARGIHCGAATVSPAMLAWYARLGIPIRDRCEYGMDDTFAHCTD